MLEIDWYFSTSLKQTEVLLFVFLKWLVYEEGWALVIILLTYLSFPYKFLTDTADNQECWYEH
jgi:hypothetical protein